MTSTGMVIIAFSTFGLVLATGASAQEEPPRLPATPANPIAPSLQGPADPGYQALIASCQNPPEAGQGRGGRGGGRGAGRGGGRGAAPAPGIRDYTVTEIPGVVAAGQRWRFLWQEAGNNGDGIIGTSAGVLLAQNDNSRVVEVRNDGTSRILYSNTRTGGSLSRSSTGALFIAVRGLRAAIMQLEPDRQVLANSYQGGPLDCVGGVLNDLTADRKGGAYFTMGGVFYASPRGEVTRYGENLFANGIVLSADERTLYVTNGPTLAAFDVQPDGSLTNQREFASLDAGGGGDGLTIDAEGRVYVTTTPGVQVIGPDEKYLGVIPTPRGTISGAFGGPDKKTFYVLARGAVGADGAEVANAAQVYALDMIAQGYMGRAK